MKRHVSLMAGAAALGALVAAAPVIAQHAHGDAHGGMMMNSEEGQPKTASDHDMPMIHGGRPTTMSGHDFEVLFTPDRTRLYVYDADGKPVDDPKDVKVTMTLMREGGSLSPISMKYMPPDPEKGRTQGCFEWDHGMSGVKDGEMKALFRMTGLEKQPVEFSMPVTTRQAVSYVCPMNDSPEAEDPGTCPKCGMKRVLAKGEAAEGMPMHHGMTGGEHHGH